MISGKAELRLGKETKNQIVKEYGLYQNPKVQSYINEVGHKIVAVCDRKNIPYEFLILDTPLVNAFAVPGYVFLTRGILELIDDEAELASVIGHEVGHITGFHSVKMIQKAFGYQFLSTFATLAVAFYGPRTDDPRAYGVINQATMLVVAGFLSGYGREFELEADRTGLRYAVLTGYEPQAMTSFFRRMKSLGEEKAMGIEIFLRTHPPTNDRIKQVKRILALEDDFSKKRRKKRKRNKSKDKFENILRSTSVVFQDYFERYHDIVRTIPKGEFKELGIIEGNVYQHSSLKFRLEVPKDWSMQHAYGKSLVSFTSKDGKAQGQLQTIRLAPDPIVSAGEESSFAGVSISTHLLTSREWAERIEGSSKLKKRTGRDVTYPAGPSYVGTYKGRDRVGRPAHFKVLYIMRGKSREDQRGYVISCAAPESSYLDYLIDFEKIMRSLNWVTSQKSKAE